MFYFQCVAVDITIFSYYYGGTNDFLFASEWYKLFNNNDARHDLSWRGIFTNMNNTTIYNMYSSGEDVLGNIGTNQGNSAPSPSCIWGSQEKLKGIMIEATDWFVGSDVCRWGFNLDIYGRPDRPGNLRDPDDAILINPTNLIVDPYFDDSYYDLFHTNSATAQAYAVANKKGVAG